MEYIATLVLLVLLAAPLFAVYRRRAAGKPVRFALFAQIVSFFAMCLLVSGLGIGAASAAETAVDPAASQIGMGLLAAALSTGLSCVGAGIAVAAAASSAIGAISENEQSFGKALIFVALAEGVALYGFLISFLILGKV